MKAIPRTTTSIRCLHSLTRLRMDVLSTRYVHSSSTKAAVAHPIHIHGPPPKPPTPTLGYECAERQKKQVDSATSLDKQSPSQTAKGATQSPLKKRFWKHVTVKETEDGYQILLDTRAVQTPTKKALKIPRTKPHLANAIALEWDLLDTAQQALKNHRIPMTSIVARAEDIVEQELQGSMEIREQILKVVLRYLDTDTLLSWAPEKNIHDPTEIDGSEKPESLRNLQICTAQPIIAFLVNRVWPGVEIKPTLEQDSIMPVPQPQETKDVIQGWIAGLSPYDLAGLERGVLASKSLLVAVRLVVEWSENFRHLQPQGALREFGIEKAAEASSLEVTWQTGRWGEVEDTHDVEKVDLRRQLGSVILLVTGETR